MKKNINKSELTQFINKIKFESYTKQRDTIPISFQEETTNIIHKLLNSKSLKDRNLVQNISILKSKMEIENEIKSYAYYNYEESKKKQCNINKISKKKLIVNDKLRIHKVKHFDSQNNFHELLLIPTSLGFKEFKINSTTSYIIKLFEKETSVSFIAKKYSTNSSSFNSNLILQISELYKSNILIENK